MTTVNEAVATLTKLVEAGPRTKTVHTWFVQSQSLTPTRILVFVLEPNSVAELVKDCTTLVVGDFALGGDPPKVHCRSRLVNIQATNPNARPGAIVWLEGDSNFGLISVRNEVEPEVSIPLPLLDDFPNFALLGGRPWNWGDEPDSDGLE